MSNLGGPMFSRSTCSNSAARHAATLCALVLSTAVLHLGGMGLGAALQRVRAVLPRLAGEIGRAHV